MKALKIIIALMIIHHATFVATAFAQSSEWIRAGKLQWNMNKAKKRGWIPTSVSCRHKPTAPKTARSPQAKVVWNKNPKQPREWAILLVASKGSKLNEVYPNLRLVKRQRFKTGIKNTTWSCELWLS